MLINYYADDLGMPYAVFGKIIGIPKGKVINTG
jgi:hypothetical protein